MAEEHKKVQEEIKEPEAKEVEKPKPKPEAFFDDIDNRDRFEKLSGKTKDFVAGLYETAKMDIVDRAKIMFNDKLFDWHHQKAIFLKFELEGREKEVQRLEESKAGHSQRIKSVQEELGPISPRLLAKAELEREEIQKTIDKEKRRAGGFESKLSYRNEKKNVYETKRNRICENVIEKIDGKLRPYEGKTEKLKEQRAQLDFEIKAFREKGKGYSGKIEDLEKRMKESPFKTERKIYRVYIKEFKKYVKENDKLIDKAIKKEAKIGHKVAKFEKKTGPWQNKKAELERMMKPEMPGAAAPRIEQEELKEEREEAGKAEIKEAEPEKKKAEPEEKEAMRAGEKEAEVAEEEQAEKPRWDSISNRERKFWIDRLGRRVAKDHFKQYEGDFEDLARHRKNQKRYIEEWKKIRGEV